MATTENHKDERAAGRAALKDFTRPIALHTGIARLLSALSGVLSIGPVWALVTLGGEFTTAAEAGRAIDTDLVWRTVNILFLTFGLRLLLYGIAGGITHFADIRLSSHIRSLVISRVAAAPLGWFTTTSAGRLRKSLHDDITQIHTLIAHQPVDITQAVVAPIAMVGYAFWVDWRLGLLSIGTIPLYILFQMWTMQGMGDKTVEMDYHLARVSATMVEFVTGITVVKAFGTTGKAHKRYQDAADDFATFYLRWVTPLLRGGALSGAVVAVPVILCLNVGVGLLLVRAGYVQPAEVLATTLIALLVPASIEVVGGSAWSYQIAGAAALRVRQAFDIPVVPEPEGEKTLNHFDVTYEDVSFSYGDLKAVEDASFHLPQGSITALVGPSGSGKSTLATLLARFQAPDQGRILLGGVDIATIPSAQLYRHVAFVLQDPQLLRISIHDNIALAHPGASREEVIEAARTAQILDVIEALPHGFDTIYHEDIGLSGGQAQRISIARAVLLNAPVLILDEATAFADPESEAAIQRALNRLVEGKTVLVIAHRPESIRGVDQIIAMDRGAVVFAGPPDANYDYLNQEGRVLE